MKIIKTIIVHTGFFAVMLASANASLCGITPFGYGTHLAVLLSGGMPLASLYFALAQIIVSPTLPSLERALILGGAGAIVWLITYLTKSRKIVKYVVHVTLQVVLYCTVLFLQGNTRFTTIASVVVGTAIGVLIEPAVRLLSHGDWTALGAKEIAGLCALTVIFFNGVEFEILGYPFARTCFAFAVLVVGRLKGGYVSAVFGVLSALGASSGQGVEVFIPIALSALGAGAFCKLRFASPFALVGAYVGAVSLFDVGVEGLPMTALALGVGCVLFLLIPKRARDVVKTYLYPFEELTAFAVACGMGRKLPDKLVSVCSALGEMGEVIGEPSIEPLQTEGVLDAVFSVCADCPSEKTCALSRDMPLLIADFVVGGDKLKNEVISLPCVLGGRLLKTAELQAVETRKMIDEAREQSECAKSYAERLKSLRSLLTCLTKEVASDYDYDLSESRAVKDTLNSEGFGCRGALVTKKPSGVIVVREAEDKKLTETLSRAVGHKIMTEKSLAVGVGYVAVGFSPAPVLDVVYAVAQKPKTEGEPTGDCYSAMRVGSKALLSLCDGSGTGKKASKLSQATLSLVENHFRAGFDAQNAVSSVNAFLSSRSGEEFSAMDIVALDLATGDADVIKAGSPSTFVVSGDVVTKIDGSALPVGALTTATQALAHKKLGLGDIVVLVTDGISDGLPNLSETVVKCASPSPKRMADGILGALKTLGDDASVLVARIIERT